MLVKESLTLKPVLQGMDSTKIMKYAWASDDETVAKVAKGVVKGVAAGTAQITCTLTDGEDLTMTATCTVTVNQPVSKITYDTKDLQIQIKSNFAFTPTVLPENATTQTLRFSSSDTTVATVNSSGVITGVNRGVCYITAEATDGSKKKLKQKVTVQTFIITDLDEIVLSERKTYTIELPEVATGYPYYGQYYLRFTKGLFELGQIYYDGSWGSEYGIWGEGKRYLTINPVKAGKGTITLMDFNAYYGGSPKAKHTIKVTVEPSAVYSVKTFPLLEYDSDTLALKTGRQVSLKGTIVDLGISNGLYAYTIATKGKRDHPVLAVVPQGKPKSTLVAGDKVTVYGAYLEPLTETTETGLTVTTPRVQIEQINDDNYNPDLLEPEYHDITSH